MINQGNIGIIKTMVSNKSQIFMFLKMSSLIIFKTAKIIMVDMTCWV